MNLLITGAWQDAKQNIAQAERMGHAVSFLQYEKDELPCSYEWVEGIICNGLFLYHPIENFKNLKYIQLTSAGFDRIPMEYVKEHGIEIYNARGVYSIPMAEFAIGGVLQLYKRWPFFFENQKQHKWEKHRGLQELYGKTVCVVGCGSVGTECAKRFQAFGCRVIGVGRSHRTSEYYEYIASMEEFDKELLSQADIVVLCVPLMESTIHLINRERLSRMKAESILINMARGAVVDTEALIDALRMGQIGGVALDVFEEEPLDEESPLWNMENVIVTPHNSFVGEGNQRRLMRIILGNLRNYN